MKRRQLLCSAVAASLAGGAALAQSTEQVTPYWIVSSARISTVAGMVRPERGHDVLDRGDRAGVG